MRHDHQPERLSPIEGRSGLFMWRPRTKAMPSFVVPAGKKNGGNTSMKLDIPFPDNKVNWFMKKIGISPDDFKLIDNYRHLFIKNGPEFSGFFFDYFRGIDDTKFLLEHLEHKDALRDIWNKWFVSFFSSSFNYNFLQTLWRSGLRHVELNIDHRYIALSYSVLRQFCQKIVETEMPADDQKPILIIIDKMADFCLLIETHAFIEATSRCDMEVVRGISHQVRNPLTVIGGHAMRLMNRAKKDARKDIALACNTIIEESKRLEKMVTDAAIYSDMYEKESGHSGVSLNSSQRYLKF
jgi:signal transduction histidine kinase